MCEMYNESESTTNFQIKEETKQIIIKSAIDLAKYISNNIMFDNNKDFLEQYRNIILKSFQYVNEGYKSIHDLEIKINVSFASPKEEEQYDFSKIPKEKLEEFMELLYKAKIKN